MPKTLIEQQRFAYFYKDRLTNLFVLDYLSLIIRYHIHSKSVYMYKIKLHNFTRYNTENSWAQGDNFLIEFANFLEGLYKKTIVFRVEGDDFMILSEYKLEDIIDRVNTTNLLKNSVVKCSVAEEFIEDVNTLISS